MAGLLTFLPIYQTRVWGGRQLEQRLKRTLPDEQPYGESWELVDRAAEQSVVANGAWQGLTLHQLWTEHREEVFGSCYCRYPATRFPLLIKVLDCADDLSIQVHPPAAIAARLNGEPKTEMWYVAAAEPGARIYAGLKKNVSREQFIAAVETGTVAEHVHVLQPAVGDSLFVPSGRLHALGRGLLIYEIQENSDTTYRVFDWNRRGLDGKPRELHTEQSLASIDFSDFEPQLDHNAQVLADCPLFKVSRIRTGEPAPPLDRFRLILPITEVQWDSCIIPVGQLTLLPANQAATAGQPQGEWLEIELPA